jgi:uncharacterized phage protein gp47/JayE
VAVTLDDGTATPAIEALNPGSLGNAVEDTQLSFVSPISGVNIVGLTSELSGGTDTETDESLRSRVKERIQQQPQGGSKRDYIRWAREVPGVTRAWCYPLENGPGTVVVRFVMDDTYSDGIPQAGDVEDVQAYLEERQPLGATVTALAPVAVPLNFEIALLNASGDPETDPTIRAAVQAELADMIFRDAEPGGTILESRIREAISIASGEYDHGLLLPAANVTHAAGQIATMGDIEWA